jgi:KDO transferase-3
MMNGSVTLLEGSAGQPFLYICDDPNFVRERPHLALQGLQSAKLAAMSLDCLGELEYLYPGCLADARIIVLQRVNRLHYRAVISDRRYAWSVRRDQDIECDFSLFKRKTNRIGFSRNLAKGYFGARTVPYAGLQVAFHLGLQRVFLIGVDLDASAGRFYEQGEQALPTTLDKDYPDYILLSFRLMAERVLKPGVFEVYNLAPGGRLPGTVIPRVTPAEFDEMLATAIKPLAD